MKTCFFLQEQGFKAFFQRDTVSEENMMFCSHCHEKQEAEIVSDKYVSPVLDDLTLSLINGVVPIVRSRNVRSQTIQPFSPSC